MPKDFAGLKEQLNKHATYRLGKPGRPFPKTRRLVVEVIIWPLDKSEVKQSVETDANGWPIGFFERTFGSIPDLPERESQGDYETRLEL